MLYRRHRMPTRGTRVNSRHVRILTAALACLLIFAPAVSFFFGERGRPMENRAPADFTGVDDGWQSVAAFGRFISDRLPLKSQAVRADAWTDEEVFGEDAAFGGGSSPRVLHGSDGFLFLADAIDAACSPAATPQQTAAHLSRLSTIIANSGRRVLMMVAPDKSSVHPELLPEDLATRACFDEYSDALWRSLDEAAIPGFINLRTLLREASAKSREPLYLRKDSHWDSAGSLQAVRAAIDYFAPGLWRDSEVDYIGLSEYTGDLTHMQGRPEVDEAPLYVVDRPDITLASSEAIDDIEGGFNRRFLNDGPDDRLIQGRTLMFLDSFGLVALPQIQPFFADLTVMRLVDFDEDRYTELISEADQVWMLTVERGSAYRLEVEVGSTQFLDHLERDLVVRADG